MGRVGWLMTLFIWQEELAAKKKKLKSNTNLSKLPFLHTKKNIHIRAWKSRRWTFNLSLVHLFCNCVHNCDVRKWDSSEKHSTDKSRSTWELEFPFHHLLCRDATEKLAQSHGHLSFNSGLWYYDTTFRKFHHYFMWIISKFKSQLCLDTELFITWSLSKDKHDKGSFLTL